MSRSKTLITAMIFLMAILVTGCSVSAGPPPAVVPGEKDDSQSPVPPEQEDTLACINFEDVALNQRITVGPGPGNSYQPALADIAAFEFEWGNGTSTADGFSLIEVRGAAGGSGHEANINNVMLYVDTGGEIASLTLRFGEYGGNLNLIVNDDFVNFGNFSEIDGHTIGGVQVTVLSGGNGNDAGVIEFRGQMNQLNGGFGQFALGGQELWIDDICFERPSDAGDSEGNVLKEVGESARIALRSQNAATPLAFHIKALNEASLKRLQIRVLLEGDVIAADLPSSDSLLSGVLVGPANEWIVELVLLDDTGGPFHYGFSAEELPEGVAKSGEAEAQHPLSCQDLLQSVGVHAYIYLLTNSPNPYVVTDPTLGTIAFHMNPAQAVQMAPHMTGAIPSLQMGGGSELLVDLSGLNCDVFKVQTNQWDTEAGSRPQFHMLGAAGQSLCGGAGQPICPSNPPQDQWSSFTTQTLEPILMVVAENEEVYFSTFVVLQ